MRTRILLSASFISVAFIFSIRQAYAIKCWHCTSNLDPACGNPFDNTTAKQMDCDSIPGLPHLRGARATMCRKIRMKINGHWRYKRDCARLGESGVGGDDRYCIYRSGTYNIHMEYCTCNDRPLCNRGPKAGGGNGGGLLMLIGSALGLINRWMLL
ncbi:UPAR/Ly6 domain-containing protein crok-like [Oratosquilla oratoria]|uniref:UPAR/Ly6 domain-containing protein crok-like n=1 Tax=Oratosquilla oratoria TaxID=337810 RepID=UPI003F75BCD6